METNHPGVPVSVQWLEAEFLRRKSDNRSYSLRAYANFLELPPGRLSEILAGKRRLSKKLGAKLAERLGLSPRQRALFENNPPASLDEDYALLSDDTFAAIADWQHTAILSLMDTKNFSPAPAAIAKRLGLTALEVKATLHRLERLGLIEKSEKGFVRSQANLRTPSGIPSAALRKSHRESLQQAIQALEEVPIEERDITSMTMAIDPAKMPLAKNLIREFRYRLADLMESGSRTEVYNLNVQFVPVTKKEKK